MVFQYFGKLSPIYNLMLYVVLQLLCCSSRTIAIYYTCNNENNPLAYNAWRASLPERQDFWFCRRIVHHCGIAGSNSALRIVKVAACTATDHLQLDFVSPQVYCYPRLYPSSAVNNWRGRRPKYACLTEHTSQKSLQTYSL
jgi:hypothetical protein